MFFILPNLQDSQTWVREKKRKTSFSSFQTYKTLKRCGTLESEQSRFSSFQTYKTLKRNSCAYIQNWSFSSFQTYKTLKPQIQFQVLTEFNTVTGAVSLFQIDYTIILIDNTCFFAVQFRFLYIF